MELSYFALIGAPNCGKTVLFNGLTGSHAKVANYPGVTVDKREGAFLDDEAVRIIDLPGTYSLRTTSPDEAVAKDVMVGKMGIPPDAIIAVADATNLRMTLRMILELKTLGLPMVVSLNLSDVARKRGLNIDAAKLSELLDAPVLETVAVSASGVQAVREAVAKLPRKRSFPANPASAERTLDALDSDKLYQEVESILAQVVRTQMTLPAWHKKLDDIVLHPVWGMIMLLVILFMVFQAVYTWAAPIMDAIEGGFTALGEWIGANMEPGILSDLLVNGVIAGLGSVLVFLPQITILFAFILLLASFACAVPAVMSARTINDPRERLVTIAVAPLLTCSARLPVYALIIAAVIPNRTVGGIFNLQGLTLFILYLAGILSAALAAYIMKRLARMKGNVQQFPLLMELPTFRTPNFKHIMTSLWDRVKAFLKRAGTIIFALAVVLWGLVSWPQPPEGATGAAIDYSLAGTLGHAIQPLFAPLGFTWEMCIAMIPGIAAREVVVAALGTVYAVSASSEDAVQNALIPIIHNNWGLPTAFAFLAWYVYAPMCAATLTVIRRETKSTKNMLMITGYLFLMAYFAAFVVYQISSRILSS